LEENLYSIWELGLEFIHDNAPIHSAGLIKDWFEDNAIPTMEWPPYSPDLNPIEHAWAKLKETIYQLDLTIEPYEGTKEALYKHFQELIEQAWSEISKDYFTKLMESMPKRVEADIAANGWYTKY
jgi:hypothetical protein